MRHIKQALSGSIVLVSVLWIATDPLVFRPPTFFTVRTAAVQYTGVLAMPP